MQLIDLEQGSSEWLAFRQTKIGGSDAPHIMNVGHKRQAQLMEEKWKAVQSYTTAAMQKGKDVEPIARDLVSKMRGTTYKPLVALNSALDWQMASLDGWDGLSFTEIKSVSKERLESIRKGDIPPEFFWQIQHEHAVCGQATGWLDAVHAIWNDSNESWEIVDHVGVLVDRDQKSIDELIEAENGFYTKLINYQLPEDAIVERTDAEFLEAAQEYQETCKALDDLEELKKIQREALVYLCGDKSCKGGGLSVTKYFAKGTVEYSKIPELKGLDLSKYRSPGSIRWRIG